jgi:hypothetical protein
MVSGRFLDMIPDCYSFSRYVVSVDIAVQNTNQFKNFEEWGKLVTAGNAQLMDLYPILRNLPAFITPEYRDAKRLSEKECALYMKNWMATKTKIINGTCHVSSSLHVFEHLINKCNSLASVTMF